MSHDGLYCVLCDLLDRRGNRALFVINGLSVCERVFHVDAARRSTNLTEAIERLTSGDSKGVQS